MHTAATITPAKAGLACDARSTQVGDQPAAKTWPLFSLAARRRVEKVGSRVPSQSLAVAAIEAFEKKVEERQNEECHPGAAFARDLWAR
jgi:hypothetical protein